MSGSVHVLVLRAAGPRVTVYMRPGCHLCTVAHEVVAQVCEALGESFVEIDIDTDPALLAAYSDEIPVTLVDGRRHDFWRVDPDRLRAALTS
ncbi:glutaredoxin family protein [Nocardioides cavernaquae]